MASIQPRGDKFQLRVKHRLLPKPYFCTFDTEQAARDYGTQLEALLARGIVPSELLAPAPAARLDDPLVSRVISAYIESAPVTDSDDELLTVVGREVAGLRVTGLTMAWAEGYVAGFKTADKHLAPGTIRKRVGALARVLDWHYARTTPQPNVLRLLPRGYSLYTKGEAAELEAEGKVVKVDVSRDRRLPAEDEAKIRRALAGEKRPDRERPLPVEPAFVLLFDLILDTGLRLSEALRLRVGQVDLERRVLDVDGSKGHRGRAKPRQVPLKRVLVDKLREWLASEPGPLVFPFWDGSPEDLRRCGNRLSARFSVLFAYAGVDDFTEHDLRHEATCRWFLLRRPDGSWTFSPIEIARLMGWTSLNMALRYASLRGEDLSSRLDD